MTQRLTVSDGVQIACDVQGDAEGPPLVLVHSLGCDHHMWDHQIGVLGGARRVVAIDIRGHGASDAPDADYTIDRLGLDVVDVADALGIGTFDYCGLSVGGLIGLWLGVHKSDRLRSLTLCNTGAKISDEARWNERITIARSDGMPALVDGVITRWFGADFEDEHPEDVARARAQLLVTDPKGYAGCCAAIRDTDLRAEVHTVGARTLIIGGERDIATPIELSEALHEEIAGSELARLDAGHLSNIEQPHAFTRALMDFLA